jgi:formate hydrogenlyase subunit 6/NADH:ubiquinone oxidoreductase subunit I
MNKERLSKVVIGRAQIDRERCLPWAEWKQCSVCQEMCPVADKAITLEEVEAKNPQGENVVVLRPVVVAERCTGCGKCEHDCPVSGRPAIFVTSEGESRGRQNG